MSSIGRRSCKRLMEEKMPLLHKLYAFRCLISRPRNLTLKSQHQILSRKLCYFRGSRFTRCFILSTALYCLLPSVTRVFVASCDRVFFFFYYYIATSRTNLVQIFTGLLFCAFVEIQQVRRLVFHKQ